MRAAVLAGIFFLLYAWRLPQAFVWDSDWARDLYDVIRLAKVKPTLVGPQLTGAVFAGPYYYYLWVPLIFLGENSILIANAAGFAIGVGATAAILGWLPAVAVGLAPFWVSAARHAGNAYTYLPLLLIVSLIAWKKRVWSGWQLAAWGGLAGGVLNTHPATLAVIGPGMLVVWKRSRRWWWFIVAVATFLPLGVFELRHGGVMLHAIASGKFWTLVTQKVGEGTEIHYLLPMGLGILLWVVERLNRYKFNWLLATGVGLWIICFPTQLFQPAARSGTAFEEAVEKVISQGRLDFGVPFNLIGIFNEERKVVSGNEYRYFFIKNDLLPLETGDYRSATALIIFSEDRTMRLDNLNTWETREFDLSTNGLQVIDVSSPEIKTILFVKTDTERSGLGP